MQNHNDEKRQNEKTSSPVNLKGMSNPVFLAGEIRQRVYWEETHRHFNSGIYFEYFFTEAHALFYSSQRILLLALFY